MVADNSKKKRSAGNENDIYTALLGLTVLILIATAGAVAFFSNTLFGSIF